MTSVTEKNQETIRILEWVIDQLRREVITPVSYEIETHSRDMTPPFGPGWRKLVQGPVRRIVFEMADLGGSV